MVLGNFDPENAPDTPYEVKAGNTYILNFTTLNSDYYWALGFGLTDIASGQYSDFYADETAGYMVLEFTIPSDWEVEREEFFEVNLEAFETMDGEALTERVEYQAGFYVKVVE